jgi:NB-ARC domain
MDPAPADNSAAPGSDRPVPGVRQDVIAYDQAQQAVQGQGVQYNYFGGRPPPEAAVSIAAPAGQRDPDRPLRGRDREVAALARPGLGVQVLCGLGGCGKTSLALEAAITAEQEGAQVWWVTAAQQAVLEAGMRALGRRVGLNDAALEHGDAADLIWQYLAGKQDRWLLVIDNADDPPVLAGAGVNVADGRGWLRPVTTPAGTVLVTSRDASPGSWGPWCQIRRVGILPPGQAAKVLADHARYNPALGSDDDAQDLAVRLGSLPLALKIAGSYLAEAAAVPAAFADDSIIATYRQYQDALERGGAAAVFATSGGQFTGEGTRGIIGATWELTLDLLDTRQLPRARPVLRLLATLADAPIPYQLLLHPATLAGWPPFDGLTGPRLWQVLQALDSFGLIDLGASDDPDPVPVARLHPLVRDTSHPADDSQRLTLLALAARLLQQAATTAEKAGQPEDPPAWSAWRLLAPHATHVLHTLAAQPDPPTTPPRRQRTQPKWQPVTRQLRGFTPKPRPSSATCSPPGCGYKAPTTRPR